MRDGTRMWRVWAVVFALVWCAAPALAQSTPNNIVIVGDLADPDVFTNDLQDGIVEAIRRSRSGVGQVFVLVQDDASPYGPISVPADANIEIRGVHVDDLDPLVTLPEFRNPSSILIQGIAGDAAITIHTDSVPEFVPGDESAFEGGQTDLLVIDGFAVTGGNNGVLIDELGDASLGETLSPVLNRLYIHGNTGTIANEGNGIRAEGLCLPFVINCSIWGNGQFGFADEGAGISIAAGASLFGLHNTILLNENYGIHFEGNDTATIRNTIVYRNGDEDEQSVVPGQKDGGLVWDIDPFIDPNFGPVSGLPATTVTLFGEFVGTSGFRDFSVHFGPPDLAPGVLVTGGDPDLTFTLPRAYNGVPGPVDVYVVRIGDGYQTRIPIAFTYVNDAGDNPIVTQVVPEWGDVAGGNYVFVLGADFERDCDVYFDLDGDGNREANEMSEKVTFLSSGELLVKVPDAASAGKVEVYVENNRTGGVSIAADPRDYEYRVTLDTRPSIVQINPHYFRDVEGDQSPTPGVTSNILVWNLESTIAPTVVKIGGLVVPYDDVILVGVFSPQSDPDSDGGSLYEIIDVEIPVSQFGAGGSYDVTVINPSGLSDTLNAGFTYYADGIPRPDPSDREWRVSNFVANGTGGDRTLQGTAYDTTIDITISEAASGANTTLAGLDPEIAAPPTPYTSHTQREIAFGWPITPDVIAGIPVAGPPRTFVVQVDNVGAAEGGPSVSATVQTSEFYYLAPTAIFDIRNISVNVGTQDTITADILNFGALGGAAAFTIFVDDVDVGTITDNSGDNVTFTVPASVQRGVYGPVDIRVETAINPAPAASDPLYYIAENAYSYRRTDPQAYGVFPRTIVEDTTVRPSPVRVTGTDFIGPFSTTTPYTRIFLDDGDGIPEIGTEDLDVSLNAVLYAIDSFMELRFTIDITTAETNQTVTIPRDTPIAIHLDNYDPLTGVALTTPTTLTAAVIISAADPPPEITDVQLVSDPSRRDGPVRGDTAVRILGFNFDTLVPSTLDPIVRIGGEEAEFVSFTDNADPTPDQILITTPSAPDLLPGTYKVVVIRPADQQQGVSPPDKDFTYFLDGAPEILEIVPNYIAFPATDDDDPRYITIVGLNFTDIVQVVFDSGGANEQTIDHYSVSPTEIVVKVPLGTDLNSVLPVTPAGEARIPVFVRNVPSDATVVTGTTNESNSVDIIIYDDDRGMEPNVAILEFNNVYLNSNDYVMVEPGTGSISIDPMFDPRDAPANPGLPGPKLINPLADPWVGKLATRDPAQGSATANDDFENPMRDKGGEFTLAPYTTLDFELHDRPDFSTSPDEVHGTGPADASASQGLPDIGADEIFTVAAATAQFRWYLAQPVPNPVPALDAGDLTILVGFRPEEFVLYPDDLRTFFVEPQGGDPTDGIDSIPMEMIESLGGGVYIISNTSRAIETVLEDFGTAGPSTQVPADLIADGHAAVYVRPDPVDAPDFILGDDPFDLSDVVDNNDTRGTINNAIQDQAELGRHFIIDTIPPRVNLTFYADSIDAMESREVVLDVNDIEDASDTDGFASHPTPNFGFINTLFDGSIWNPAVMDDPIDQFQTANPFAAAPNGTDDGLVLPAQSGPSSTSIFFNPFSLSNLTAGSDLQFRVEVEFVDPPVVDSTNTPVTGVDFYTTTDDPRQVSGFDQTSTASAVDGATNVLNGPVRWDILRGAALLLDTAALPVQISNSFATSGANVGLFDLSLAPDEAMSPSLTVAAHFDNANVTASWGGPSDATSDPMIFADLIDHLDAAAFGGFNLSIQFDGEDLAGNDSSDDEDNTLLNPLNIYWYRDVNSRIAGISDDPFNTISNPLPTFSLIRDGDPNPEPNGGPTPIYSYRLWNSNDLAVNTGLAQDFQFYDPIGAWQPWLGDETITTISSDLLGFSDEAILLVVHGADEAGNVEPWDQDIHGYGPDDQLDMTSILIDGSGRTLDEYASDQPNWVRFFFSGSAPPDTRVRANFWHDDKGNNLAGFPPQTNLVDLNVGGLDSNLGNLTIVPMPVDVTKRVVGQFFVSVEVPPAYTPADDIFVDWELFCDGIQINSGSAPLERADDVFPVVLPGLNNDVPDGLGDINNREEDFTYVFRATARIARTGLPGSVSALADASPASVVFTVVPFDAQTFVAQAIDPDRQPIVILEEQ